MTKHKSDIDLLDDVEKIKSAIFGTTQDVQDKAAELYSESLNKTASYVTKKPIASLGIALGVGVLIGLLLRK